MMRHPVEQQLLTACGITDEAQLRRLGIFLVAHTVMDTHLVSVLVDHEAGKVGGAGVLSLDHIRTLSDDITSRTFKQHLNAARGVICSRAVEIADEINRGRDAFVHFKRDRFMVPHYHNQPVTEEAGFEACMNDVQEFLNLVPWRNPAWTVNP
jgi:hypothetical protein